MEEGAAVAISSDAPLAISLRTSWKAHSWKAHNHGSRRSTHHKKLSNVLVTDEMIDSSSSHLVRRRAQSLTFRRRTTKVNENWLMCMLHTIVSTRSSGSDLMTPCLKRLCRLTWYDRLLDLRGSSSFPPPCELRGRTFGVFDFMRGAENGRSSPLLPRVVDPRLRKRWMRLPWNEAFLTKIRCFRLLAMSHCLARRCGLQSFVVVHVSVTERGQ